MNDETMEYEDLKTISGGVQPLDDGYVYYRCGDCGYEFREAYSGSSASECPNCGGHWIGIHKDCI